MEKGVIIVCTYCWISITIIAAVFAILSNNYLIWQEKQLAKARKKCEEYTQLACNGSISKPTSTHADIMSGEFAIQGQFPHMAFLSIMIPGSASSCGGTLISENFVLTACHCTQKATSEDILVKLGSLSSENVTTDHPGMFFKVKKIYKHPGFSMSAEKNDVSVLQLERKVDFTSTVRPICLNTELDPNQGNVTASGWGFTGVGSIKASDRLKWVDLHINDAELIEKCYGGARASLEEYTICAVSRNEKKSTCEGDSGGPLQIPAKNGCTNTYEQLGITSFGVTHCSVHDPPPTFGYYSRLHVYVPWIANIVWPDG